MNAEKFILERSDLMWIGGENNEFNVAFVHDENILISSSYDSRKFEFNAWIRNLSNSMPILFPFLCKKN